MTEDTNNNPAAYRRDCARSAEKLTLLGATRAELALYFGVDVATLERWAEEHKDFDWALQVEPTILGVRPEDTSLFGWLKDYRLGNLDI
jgi:hypothetical protein